MYGILAFSSKSRVLITGVQFTEYKTNHKYIVHTRKEYHKDMWAKVNNNHELMEILGPTGDYENELNALRGAYGLHYKYPHPLYPIKPYTEKAPMSIDAYTVDQASTLDRDDAISVSKDNHYIIVGIHITDLVARLNDDENKWLSWARLHGSSAYWKNGTKPIFPPQLAHNELSLTAGGTYPCLSLFLKYATSEENGNVKYTLEYIFFGPCDVSINQNLTYDDLATPSFQPFYSVLRDISDRTEPTEIIEWFMIQYNLYMAINLPDVLLRVQDEGEPARYDYSGTHFTMGNRVYTHATSPIRRFTDFYNQCMYYNSIKNENTPLLTSQEIDDLNKRMDEVREFHYKETIMSLAYEYKDNPKLIEGCIDVDEDGKYIRLVLEGKRVKIPLNDVYYEEPIVNTIINNNNNNNNNNITQFECFGIHKHGKVTLRIRIAV